MDTKKYITLENLEYFLERFKYELAHNGPAELQEELEEQVSEESDINS